MTIEKDDAYWMREAIRASAGGALLAPPNPSVGCVLVRDGEEIARGFTQRPGGHHAEIEAIENALAAGKAVAGATAYVTLEPCSHYGRTPPCALRLIREKIGRVVIGTLDPNPLVAGRGKRMLEEAGIPVTACVLEDDAFFSNRGFLTRMQRGTPWVRVKVAASLDGRTALENGQSQWITGEAARAHARRERAFAQGLLTGIGTVLADDPQMNVREPGLPSPAKYILDAHARLPLTARILSGAPVTVFVGPGADADRVTALVAAGVRVLEVGETATGRLDLRAVLAQIGRDQVNVLFVEGGATLTGAFLEEDLADEILLYMAPAVLGPGRALAAIAPRQSMTDVLRWRVRGVESTGEDVLLHLSRRETP